MQALELRVRGLWPRRSLSPCPVCHSRWDGEKTENGDPCERVGGGWKRAFPHLGEVTALGTGKIRDEDTDPAIEMLSLRLGAGDVKTNRTLCREQ